ncbi:hypothetical protein Q8F55_000771 [Vanrija albida]|uniref:STM1-like N-terminal domain-containing protein n=1 Tax=Vanrija albida TaxID=181172 RepID=A0ABR3QEC9_9TREE
MSVVSKNPFDLLGDDGEERAPSPAPKAGAAKATPAPASAQPKVVPGAAPKGGRGARYPARGGPRNVYREERPAEGGEGFEGERVAPPKKDHQGRDRHTKGPREDRTHTGPRSRAPGAAGARGPKGGARGGRAAGGAAAGDKKAAPAESWNNDEGKAELSAEKQGETDGVEAAAAPAEEVAEEVVEEEDTSKTLDQYLAEKAEAALSGDLGKKEVRQVTADNLEGTAFKREEDEDFFSGKAKTSAPKEKAPKKEKVYIEVDGTFASPARPPRTGGDRPTRGRGGPGGARGGQRGSGPRGGAAPRGGAQRAPRQQAVSVNDTSAFPALGA